MERVARLRRIIVAISFRPGFLDLSGYNRRFCPRYKQTIVKKAQEFQHESRNERGGVAVICGGGP